MSTWNHNLLGDSRHEFEKHHLSRSKGKFGRDEWLSQAMEFEEAEKLCAHSLLIHTEHCKPGSLEEAADRRLLALIFSARGEHGKALDCLVYANDILVNYDREVQTTAQQSASDGDLRRDFYINRHAETY